VVLINFMRSRRHYYLQNLLLRKDGSNKGKKTCLLDLQSNLKRHKKPPVMQFLVRLTPNLNSVLASFLLTCFDIPIEGCP
jgi:hypothetical protein